MIRNFVVVIVCSLVTFACAGKTDRPSPGVAKPPGTSGKSSITHNPNGATVERIELRKPIITKFGKIINVVFRIKNVPGAPHLVFYVPCEADGGCQAQPIPGDPRAALTQDGDIITISNTSADMTQKR